MRSANAIEYAHGICGDVAIYLFPQTLGCEALMMTIPEGETVAPSIYAFRANRKTAKNLPLWLDFQYHEIALDRQNPHWQGPYINVRTGQKIMLRSADCGLGCHCAAEWKEVK
jgi:hypothetical protein